MKLEYFPISSATFASNFSFCPYISFSRADDHLVGLRRASGSLELLGFKDENMYPLSRDTFGIALEDFCRTITEEESPSFVFRSSDDLLYTIAVVQQECYKKV